jgi:hypothetical protein
MERAVAYLIRRSVVEHCHPADEDSAEHEHDEQRLVHVVDDTSDAASLACVWPCPSYDRAMGHTARVVLGLVAAPVCALLIGGAIASASTPARECSVGNLRVIIVQRFQGLSEEDPVALRLMNVGASTCWLHGYPAPRFVDAGGRVLRLAINDGGDRQVTSDLPRRVRVRAGGVAFALVIQEACADTTHGRQARTLRISLPGSPRSQVLKLPEYPLIEGCRGRDPSGKVYVSPFEPTVRATETF